jgi:hypothetical protein
MADLGLGLPSTPSKFDFTHSGVTFYGPGKLFKTSVAVAKQTEKRVCWNAALTMCVNASLGVNLLTTDMVAKLTLSDLVSWKELRPNEFVDAVGMVINSKIMPAKIKLIEKRWKVDNDAIACLKSSLYRGHGAMISVNHEDHVQVVFGYSADDKLLLYDTADEGLEVVPLAVLAKHAGTDWIYMFDL